MDTHPENTSFILDGENLTSLYLLEEADLWSRRKINLKVEFLQNQNIHYIVKWLSSQKSQVERDFHGLMTVLLQ